MTLKDELLALKPLLGTDSPEFYTKMTEIAAKYNSEEDKKAIANFVSERLQNIDKKLDVIEESAIKLQLQEVAEIVSLSYLAKKLFQQEPFVVISEVKWQSGKRETGTLYQRRITDIQQCTTRHISKNRLT